MILSQQLVWSIASHFLHLSLGLQASASVIKMYFSVYHRWSFVHLFRKQNSTASLFQQGIKES